MTRIPEQVMQDSALQSVFDAIEAGGHRAWLVGGAVRNALLGEPVGDLDLATDAPPEVVMRLAQAAGLKPVPTGIDHGTVTVVSDGRGFEVTTLRHDVETDGRHAVVAFSDDLDQDARRRDFTMNALYADRHGTVIDPVGGLDDLRARRLRFVGDPAQRIAEDYLRILRFFRFLAWYGREADPAAVAACRDGRDGLGGISRERIGQELRKLLAAPDPVPAVRLMQQTGVLDKVLPGATPDRLYGLQSPAPWLARLAALSQADLADALRLSRNEARDHRALVTALTQGWSFNRIAFHLRADLADAAAALVQTSGPREGWAEARAAARPLPIAASDLQPHLQGPALGRALKAAEDAWIDSGFAMPAPALIDIALLAGETA
ncbi:CCA tRNA nucleotidyltransferase [Paracoccus sp. WLY502]|uniref:CCA tRNA nucleotidyltransferase n=1 Tax=Paracoccus yibinensis TaxID=3068891 RepID=UPI002796667A|nr:CCA tRNA nucleotidyltransferase [Paracoccus sp. WLY502]MDQ1900749.1 CCA tRNA nucleotidyltransferase [Paracoccus sp. WLY502]